VVSLERERSFHFSKLGDFEPLIQQVCEENPEIEKQGNSLIKHAKPSLSDRCGTRDSGGGAAGRSGDAWDVKIRLLLRDQ
jgi:hypothetical protein